MPKRGRAARLPARPTGLVSNRPWEDNSDQPSDDEGPWGEAAGDIFANFVLDLQYQGKVSAKYACLLCYWAHRAGAPEAVGRLGFRPNAQSGQYQRHLDTVLETKMHSQWYTVEVPGHNKHEQSRVLRKTPVLLPYDELVEEVAATPGFQLILKSKIDNHELSDLYYQHPEHTSDSDVPIGLFIDAVPTVKKDSCLGFFVFNVITGTRFLCAILRKRGLCHCGCRGWCSFYAMWEFFAWAFTAMARGIYPTSMHSGEEFPPGAHADRAGTNMPFKGLLNQLKADWGEWGSSMGFAGHATTLYPCVCCFASSEDWFQIDDTTFEHFPWEETKMQDYESACEMCEIPIELQNRRQHAMLRARLAFDLAFDRRPHGGRGRCLTEDIPSLQLLQGDRLEPCPTCQDIGTGFDELAGGPYPVRVLFGGGARRLLRGTDVLS